MTSLRLSIHWLLRISRDEAYAPDPEDGPEVERALEACLESGYMRRVEGIEAEKYYVTSLGHQWLARNTRKTRGWPNWRS